MKKLRSVVRSSKLVLLKLLAVNLLTAIILPLYGWGFWAHKKINYTAVFTLPVPLFYFYKKNIEYIKEHAVDPDKRRYLVKGEGARHYIDLDHYCSLPCENLPRNWFAAIDSYSKDTLMTYGIVPYHIQFLMYKLENAFKDLDHPKIVKISADLGHYIADAHVPLHTTKNYNGQLTGQKGIHGFWESRLPELFGEEYDYFTGRAVYIEDPTDFIWNFVFESHNAVDSVLTFEAILSREFPSDRKYTYQERGQTMTRAYSKEYSEHYHQMLDRMVEKRLRRSVIDIGSIWYTCWVNAGSPDLSHKDSLVIIDSIKYPEVNIKTRKHPDQGFE